MNQWHIQSHDIWVFFKIYYTCLWHNCTKLKQKKPWSTHDPFHFFIFQLWFMFQEISEIKTRTLFNWTGQTWKWLTLTSFNGIYNRKSWCWTWVGDHCSITAGGPIDHFEREITINYKKKKFSIFQKGRLKCTEETRAANTHDKPRRLEFFKQKFAVRKHCCDQMINKRHTWKWHQKH